MAYKRKTEDEYHIQAQYPYNKKNEWEMVTIETTWSAAKEQCKCYRENEPGVPFRIKKKRVPIQQEALS